MKDLNKNKKDISKFFRSLADNESSEEQSSQYLIDQGLNPQEIINNSLKRIELAKNALQTSRIESEKIRVQGSGKMWTHISVAKLIADNNTEVNPIELIKEKARDLVLKAFNLGWSGPPYNPIELAKIFQIDVLRNDSIPDARIIPSTSNHYTIEYNPFQKEARRNFSIAHEIAHTLFPDCANQIRNREEDRANEWELEYLCDVAAAEILLPYSTFTHEANSVELNLTSILEISDKYKASLESVFLRFCEVVDKPCAMIIAHFNSSVQNELIVDYFKSSRVLNLPIPSKYLIPKNSKAYECLNAGWTAKGLEQWDVFGNTRYQIFAIGLSPIKRNNLHRVGIFIVPEFYNSQPQSKIYEVLGDAREPRGPGNKIIVQLLNTSGGVGFGFGKSMAVKWPQTKKNVESWKSSGANFRLGGISLLPFRKRNLCISNDSPRRFI